MKILNLFILFILISYCSVAQPIDGRKYSDHYMSRYEQFQNESPINSNDIVFLGNSLTQGGKWSEFFPKTQAKLELNGGSIRNRGIIGDDAIGMYDRLNQILPGKPKKIFLLVGVNDISHNLSPEVIIENIEKVIARIRSESPNTKLYIQSLLPFNTEKNRYKAMIGKTQSINDVNIKLKEVADKYKLKFIYLYKHFTAGDGNDELMPDLTNDGLHINDKGYKIWVKQIKKYVK